MTGTSRRQTMQMAGLAAAGVFVAGTAGAAASPASAAGRPDHAIRYSTVYQRYQDGYHTFRIPAILHAADGTLLAFAEARVNSPGDDGNVDLVVKRSADGGQTWGPLQVLVDDGTDRFANPVPILDRRTGRIVVNTTRTGGNVTGDDIRCGRATAEETRRSFIMYSDDHGATWTDPVEITSDVKPEGWRHFVGGPGHGIQLRHGRYAGRLVVPGNHSLPEQDGISDCEDNRLFSAHCLFSDDGGQTWQLGGVDTNLDGVVNANESQCAELSDGTVYFNARDQHGSSVGARCSTTSGDGGANFDAPYAEVADLTAPVVQGSVLKLSRRADVRERLVFSAPGKADAREDLTLSTSSDEAASWQPSVLVYRGPAGYSDLVELDGRGRHDRALGVLYENGVEGEDEEYNAYSQKITFARVPVARL